MPLIYLNQRLTFDFSADKMNISHCHTLSVTLSGGVSLLKKIPCALLLMAVYVVMTFTGTTTVLSGNEMEAANTLDSIGRIANFIIAIGPIVLAVLILVQTIKPLVGQVVGILCLVLAVAYGYRSFLIFQDVKDYLSVIPEMDANALFMVETLLASIIFTFLFWFTGARIQDEEVTGIYRGIGTIGILLTILVALAGTSLGVMPLNVFPTLLLMYTVKRLPPVFVTAFRAQGIKIKHIVILAVFVAAYYFIPTGIV